MRAVGEFRAEEPRALIDKLKGSARPRAEGDTAEKATAAAQANAAAGPGEGGGSGSGEKRPGYLCDLDSAGAVPVTAHPCSLTTFQASCLGHPRSIGDHVPFPLEFPFERVC